MGKLAIIERIVKKSERRSIDSKQGLVQVQDGVQREIDSIEREGFVTLRDRKNLPYTNATICVSSRSIV